MGGTAAHGPRNAVVLGLAALGLCLGGCSSRQDVAVQDAATAFYAAVDRGAGERACAWLTDRARSAVEQSSGSPCGRGVLGVGIPTGGRVDEVRVYDSMAQVQLGSETAFLTRTDGGWRLLAVACTPGPKRQPYDCVVAGG